MTFYCEKENSCPKINWMIKSKDMDDKMILNECRFCDERK